MARSIKRSSSVPMHASGPSNMRNSNTASVIHLHVDVLDAGLRAAVVVARVPGTGARYRVADLVDLHASPFAAGWQLLGRLAGKLERQHHFTAVLPEADHMRADLPR